MEIDLSLSRSKSSSQNVSTNYKVNTTTITNEIVNGNIYKARYRRNTRQLICVAQPSELAVSINRRPSHLPHSTDDSSLH